MKHLRRLGIIIALLLFMNSILIYNELQFPLFIFLLPIMVLIGILPCYEKGLNIRLQVLSGGYELIVTSFYALVLEIAIYLTYCLSGTVDISPGSSHFWMLIVNGIVAFLLLLLHYLNGFWRVAICSSQLGIGLRILMFFFWWLPPVNIVLFGKWCGIVRREIYFERHQYLLNAARVESAICRTRYPVVMVHGIFFRDWQFMNYWGRIPHILKKNGAVVYYGKQQSSRCIADSAAELKSEIERILAETGAEKVNIVAHSKGGLDSRYAISRLGLAQHVASLTTINTPHRGCPFVDALLETLPNWMVRFVSKRYNAIFHRLGDPNPDFLAGVQDLTHASCTAFNEAVPDHPSVYYQSWMSRMASVRSAGFPLNLGYLLVKKYEGDNDGLVSTTSAEWGHYMGLLTAGKKGISHADMIDLTHKNIKGFDVAEFYAQVLKGLKEMGL